MTNEEQELCAAFKLMWDSFPEPVMLLKRDRTITAINKAAVNNGVECGGKCVSLPPAERHKNCKAEEALKTGVYQYRKRQGANGDVISFWLPIENHGDYFVHFSVGRMVKYELSDPVSFTTN